MSFKTKENEKANDGLGKFGTRKSGWDFHKGSWFSYSGHGPLGITQGWLMT